MTAAVRGSRKGRSRDKTPSLPYRVVNSHGRTRTDTYRHGQSGARRPAPANLCVFAPLRLCVNFFGCGFAALWMRIRLWSQRRHIEV